MTTIVVDRRLRILAADTQSVLGGNCKNKVTKLWTKGNIGVAVTGSLEEGIQIRDYMFGMLEDKEVPMPEIEETSALAVEFHGSKSMRGYTVSGKGLVLVPIELQYLSMGSGSGYAMGAMACGKTGIEAIKIASQFDPYTNNKVMYFDGNSIKRK